MIAISILTFSNFGLSSFKNVKLQKSPKAFAKFNFEFYILKELRFSFHFYFYSSPFFHLQQKFLLRVRMGTFIHSHSLVLSPNFFKPFFLFSSFPFSIRLFLWEESDSLLVSFQFQTFFSRLISFTKIQRKHNYLITIEKFKRF